MAAIQKGPRVPLGRQQSTSELSDPPDSVDGQECMAEITVRAPQPAILHNHTPANDNKMAPVPETTGTHQQDRRSKRPRRPTRQTPVSMSEDELVSEIQVAPLENKRGVAAKRSQVTNTRNANTKRPAAKKVKVTNRRSGRWDPENVTQSTRSPLVNVDLRSLLLQPAAWDCLTAEDKLEILALFPDDTHILNPGTPDAQPNFETLRNDDSFRHDAEEYTSNLARGMHDPAWLGDAWAAHHRRAAGDFDAFYIRKLEVDWNTTIPDEYRPEHLRSNQNGESSAPGGQSAQDYVTTGGNDSVKTVSPLEKEATDKEQVADPVGGEVDATSPTASNGTADNITAVVEKASISNGGARFEVVPEDDDVNGKVTSNGMAHGDSKAATNGMEETSGNKDAGSVTVGGETAASEPMEVDSAETQ